LVTFEPFLHTSTSKSIFWCLYVGKNAVPVAFDPMQYVVAELFRGHELRVEQITGSFSVLNETAFSMAESLMTMVIRPQDSDTALTFNLLALLVVDFFVRGARFSRSTTPTCHDLLFWRRDTSRIELAIAHAPTIAGP